MTARSVEVEGLGHGNMPIPTGCRVGPLLMSGGISGLDTGTGTIPNDGSAQVSRLFDNVRHFMEAAGGDVSEIAKMTFFVVDRGLREAINILWVEMFPDQGSRPARHTLVTDLVAPMLVQCEVVAFLSGQQD